MNVPFCRSICHFCDFYKNHLSSYGRRFGERTGFSDLLKRELDLHLETTEIEPASVYLGGGSPLELPGEGIAPFLDELHARFDLRDAEVTVEANPSRPGEESGWRARGSEGFNRISVGVQSFSEAALRTLGRAHVVDPAYLASLPGEVASVTADFVYDVPGHGEAGLREDLARAIDLGWPHLSWYGLESPAEAFERTRPHRSGDPAFATSMRLVAETLRSAGYERYEISNWGRGSTRSVHNLGYWTSRAYLGIGPGAWGMDFDRATGTWRRYLNEKHLGKWAERIDRGEKPWSWSESLGETELRNERVMLALRTAEGLDLGAFALDFGADQADHLRRRFVELEAGAVAQNRLQMADWACYNSIVSELLIENS